MFRRSKLTTILERLREPRHFIQVLAGPRQVGKTTLAQQAMAELTMPCHKRKHAVSAAGRRMGRLLPGKLPEIYWPPNPANVHAMACLDIIDTGK